MHNFRALQEIIIHVLFKESENIEESNPLISDDLRLSMPQLHNKGIMRLSVEQITWGMPCFGRQPELSFFP
jgi:hypothetical protein